MKAKPCDMCRFADFSDAPRTIADGNVTITQQGKHNMVCKAEGIANLSIDMSTGSMRCSAFEQREEYSTDER